MQISKAGPSTFWALSRDSLLGAERGELGLGREGFLRPVTGDREGGIAGRLGERRLEREPASEITGEAANEGVAGAGGVDGLTLDLRDALRAIRGREQRTARAKRHDDRLDALADQALRGGGNLVVRLDGHVGQDGELGLVGDEEARLRDDAHVEVAPRWGRIEHGPDAVLAREANRLIGGFKLDLELQQDEIATPERLARRVYVGGAQVAVRAGDDQDRIVARLLVNQNRGRAGRLVRNAPDMLRIDPVALEILERAVA